MKDSQQRREGAREAAGEMSSESSKPPVAAVDFGGTNIRTAIVHGDGSIHGSNFERTEGTQGPESVLRRVGDSIQSSLDKVGTQAGELAAIGVAAPGPLDFRRGIVLEAPNIPGFENVDVAGPLARRFGAPAFLGNDANLAALAEHEHGAGRGVGNMVYVTVSTGVGGGVLVNGELLLGATGNAGEVGHMTVDLHGERHNCGNIGCVEGLAAGGGMADYARRQVEAGRSSSLGEILVKNGSLSGKDVVDAASAGDPLGQETLRRGVEALAAGFVSFIHVLNPELIVVGGGVTRAGDMLFEPLRRIVFERLMPGFGENLRIVPWTLGENVGILGAAAWAHRMLRPRGG